MILGGVLPPLFLGPILFVLATLLVILLLVVVARIVFDLAWKLVVIGALVLGALWLLGVFGAGPPAF